MENQSRTSKNCWTVFLKKCNRHNWNTRMRRESTAEEKFELIMANEVLKWMTDTKAQMQEAQKTQRNKKLKENKRKK